MMKTGHRVEEVSHMASTGIECLVQGFDVGPRVSDRRDPSLPFQFRRQPNAARYFGSEGRHMNTVFELRQFSELIVRKLLEVLRPESSAHLLVGVDSLVVHTDGLRDRF